MAGPPVGAWYCSYITSFHPDRPKHHPMAHKNRSMWPSWLASAVITLIYYNESRDQFFTKESAMSPRNREPFDRLMNSWKLVTWQVNSFERWYHRLPSTSTARVSALKASYIFLPHLILSRCSTPSSSRSPSPLVPFSLSQMWFPLHHHLT
jgi:hypothetical protein